MKEALETSSFISSI